MKTREKRMRKRNPFNWCQFKDCNEKSERIHLGRFLCEKHYLLCTNKEPDWKAEEQEREGFFELLKEMNNDK